MRNDKYDSIGERLKAYEAFETTRKFIPLLPVYARIDGRGFSKFTKGMNRPYDERMSEAMVDTTKYLVEKTNARIGYVQSDEISLVWYSDRYDGEIFFNGKIQKMVSVLAAMATAKFTNAILSSWDDDFRSYWERMPHFDCRVFQLPNQTEATNTFLWREQDATKNAISMAAHHYFSHKKLQGKNGAQMQEMLFEKGINFNDYPDFFKRGTFVRRCVVEVPKSAAMYEFERAKNPNAEPDTVVKRSVVKTIPMPKFSTVTNRNAVIFDGAEPETKVND